MCVLCAGARLKEQCTLDSDKAKSLTVDLHRRDEETADLREKLADSKRQIQQVHKEVRLPAPLSTPLKISGLTTRRRSSWPVGGGDVPSVCLPGVVDARGREGVDTEAG